MVLLKSLPKKGCGGPFLPFLNPETAEKAAGAGLHLGSSQLRKPRCAQGCLAPIFFNMKEEIDVFKPLIHF